jgi:predicted phosphoribosyltransferase
MFHQSHRPLFSDRREAGLALASKLPHYAGRNDVVVLALPRGRVPVAFEVAESAREYIEWPRSALSFASTPS